MSAHLRCARCGRQPWQELEVHVSDDGVPLCNGEDCDAIAAGLTGVPKRRTAALAAMMLTAATMPGAYDRRSPIERSAQDEAAYELAAQESARLGPARLAAAAAKRARKNAKRLPERPEPT